MEIDDILEILFDGTKEEIEKVLKEQKISYTFADNLEAYTVKNNNTLEVVRGSKCHYTPNCVKYFGKESSNEIQDRR
jgi:hypothetical protein|nr:MAG TPA_asm: hypothetical protein [Caudoviricetes sp.]